MRTRFPALALGIALVVGSLSASITVAPGAVGATWPVRGIDVSKWQHPFGAAIDWAAVADDGVSVVVTKATEGKKDVDPWFVSNAAGAAAEGIVVGMYHVATPSQSMDDARAEADHFLAVAGPTAGNIIPALDIEISHVPDAMTPAELEAWSRAWVNRVANRLGARPMIYGSIYLFETKLGNTTWFADHGIALWLARWGALPATLPANDWQGQGWTFWQWTNTGSIQGITGDVDRDRFIGPDLATATIASVTAQPGAGGAIADASGRWSCAAGATCSELYSPNDLVQLAATPLAGYSFVSWGGACAPAGSTPTCSLTALGNRTVTATFSYTLKVKIAGDGDGEVTSTPAAISCPGTCTATFAPGAGVTLTAAPDPWSDLTWSGDCTGSDPNGCAVTMDQPRTVTATFADAGPATATIRPPGARNGPLRVRFDEPVHHVTAHNLVLRTKSGTPIAGTLRCFDVDGHRTPCGAGAVRSAELQPRSLLKRDRVYVAVVDPAGVTPIVDRVGNPTPLVRKTFSFA
jgi:GH25 family lysozyme M1 (1,4-beta-N-acetylmuramidase)